MKTILSVAAVLVFGLSTTVWASVLVMGGVKQPMNMGPESDPKRIPVGWVPYESNHGYGIIGLISEPFPMHHGAWQWEGGLEMNGNLASAFGISVEPGDITTPVFAPVKIRVRKQAVPGYSPYTKEQVLLATLRCLLDSVHATEQQPLTVVVKAEDPNDAALERFSKDYVTHRMAEVAFEPTALPGVSKEVTPGGMEMIVFDDVAESPDAPALREPSWVVFHTDDEADSDHLLLPAWEGNRRKGDALSVLGKPWPILQDVYDPSEGNPDVNVATRDGMIGNFRADRTDEGVELIFGFRADQTLETRKHLAAVCWAAVLTERPTKKKPLKISFRLHEPIGEAFQDFIEAGWEKGVQGHVEEIFVWDVEKGVLTQGKIPDLDVRPGVSGGWVLFDQEEEVEVP